MNQCSLPEIDFFKCTDMAVLKRRPRRASPRQYSLGVATGRRLGTTVDVFCGRLLKPFNSIPLFVCFDFFDLFIEISYLSFAQAISK